MFPVSFGEMVGRHGLVREMRLRLGTDQEKII
jgi:hypothetical protein